MSTPGIGDPYWYEWSVGLMYIIDMLNTDNEIEYVILQSEEHETIDDVVVVYKDGKKQCCYQIKHSIDVDSQNNLTFSKLLERKRGKSLLRGIADGWKSEILKSESNQVVPIIYTNRNLGPSDTYRKKIDKDEKYRALSLESFLNEIKTILKEENEINTDTFSENEDLRFQWEEFVNEIDLTSSEAIIFIKELRISASAPTLEETEQIVIKKIISQFACNTELANKLFLKLAAQMRIWATSRRETEKIIAEDVFTVLSENNNEIVGDHEILPPVPFFNSRKEFCKQILKELKTGTSSVVFIEGNPGTGKTSLASYLYKVDKVIKVRFHAFKPIRPDKPSYHSDFGVCDARSLWGDLLVQIRSYFKGKIGKYQVPIINDFCSVEELKKQVIRLAEIMYRETGERIVICIDGIDHAARSRNDVNFLGDLVSPEDIPNGVCFLIIGQPSSMYSKYPIWLRNDNRNVKKIIVPELSNKDIEQLIEDRKIRTIDSQAQIEILAAKIKEKTLGNNLSIVFTIEEIVKFNNLEETYNFIDTKGIDYDISRYYDRIWNHAITELSNMGIGISFPAKTIAAILVLHNGYVNCLNISAAMNSYNLNEGDWKSVMELLYPLVQIDSKGYYYVFHNDFNVYLAIEVNNTDSKYKDIASKFANYYWSTDRCVLERVQYGVNMIMNCDNNDMIGKAFNPKFVIECLAERLAYYKIYEYAKYTLKVVIENKNLVELYSVGQAISTMKQHEQYFDYYNKDYVSNDEKAELYKIHIWELESWPLTNRNLDDYYNVIKFINDILEEDFEKNISRAKYIYELWYKEYNPILFIQVLESNSETNKDINYDLIDSIYKIWGRVVATIGKEHFYSIIDNNEELSDKVLNLCINFNDSYLNYIYEKKLYDRWEESLDKGGFSLDCIEKQISLNITLESSKILEKSMNKVARKGRSRHIRLIAILNLLLSKNDDFISNGIELFKHIKIKPMEYFIEEEINEILAWSICYSHINYEKSLYELLYTLNKYIKVTKDKDDFKYMEVLLKIAVLVGKISGHKINNNKITYISKNDFGRIVNEFLNIRNGFRSYNYNNISEIIIKLLISCNEVIDESFKETLDNEFENFLHSIPIERYSKKIVLDYFVNIGKYDVIKDFIDLLYGKNGQNILNNQDSLESHNNWRKYGSLVNNNLMELVDNQLKWEVVNYIDHKEYAIYQPLEWYEEIIIRNKDSWKKYGLQLYNQSLIASQIGSNRASGQVEKIFAKSAYSNGIDAYWDLLNIDRKIYYDIELMYLVIFEAIEACESENDAYIIWIWAVGILSWYNKDDRHGISNIIKALKNKSVKYRWNEIIDKIKSIFPLYYSFYTDMQENVNTNMGVSNYSIERENILNGYREKMEQMSDDMILDDIIKLEKNTSYIWDILCEAIKLFKSRRSINRNIDMVISIIKQRDDRYSWQHSGIEKIIKLLMQDITENKLWNLIEGFNYYFEQDNYNTLFYSLRDNIHLICIEGFKTYSHNMLEEGFNMALNCQKLWVTGAGNIDVNYDLEDRIDVVLPKPNDISELVFNILIIQLGSHNVHRINMAIYGIHQLYLCDTRVPKMIINVWSELADCQIKQLLLILERWSIEANERFEEISILLLNEFDKINRLDYKMQMFYIINNYHKRIGKKQIEFTIQEALTYEEQYEYISEEISQDNNSYIESKLNRIAYILNDDTGDLKIIYKRLKIFKSDDREIYPSRRGDCIISLDTKESFIMEKIYSEFKKGRWGNKIVNLAQALLNNDDPMIITEPPKNTMNRSIWEYEGKIEKHIEDRNISAIKYIAMDIFSDELKDNECALASKIYMPYGYKDKECTVYYSKSILNITNLGKRCDLLPNVNLKSTLIEEDYFEPLFDDVDESLFRVSSGMSDFYNSNCDLYPSKYLKKLFNWTPDKNNPLVWYNHDGKVAMRFEMISNPVRETIQQKYYRQPILFRWICNKEVLHDTLTKINIVLKENWEIDVP